MYSYLKLLRGGRDTEETFEYTQGNIIILELPFTDLLRSKLRLVLVLDTIDLGNDITVTKIACSSDPYRVPAEQFKNI